MQADRQEYSKIEVGSSRSFAVVFAVVFAIIGAYPLLRGGDPRLWALAIAGAFVVVGVVYPKALQPLNVLWFKFGMLLGRIINPLVMLIIYVVTVVPIGIILRLVGKDLLSLKIDDSTSSYWIVRAPPGPEPKSLEDQF